MNLQNIIEPKKKISVDTFIKLYKILKRQTQQHTILKMITPSNCDHVT